LQLSLELSRPPSGIADDQARARQRVGLEQSSKQIGRRRQIQGFGNPRPSRLVVRLGFVAHQHPAALRLDGTAEPDLKLAFGRESVLLLARLEIHDDPPARHERPIDHEPERSLLAVLAQQNDRAAEVRIRELRHRQQQRGG
jgi:hypothetical protein